MITAEQVFEFIRDSGPVLPKDISSHFNIDTLFASAYLSELSSKGMIEVSNIKVGGSPLYYTPGQKDKLSAYKENLHEKEQKTYEMLRNHKVLEDLSLDLIDRVALRKMKDYAVPLNVVMGYEKRLFWKFFTVTDAEAQQIIASIVNPPSARQQPRAEPASDQNEQRPGVKEKDTGVQKKAGAVSEQSGQNAISDNFGRSHAQSYTSDSQAQSANSAQVQERPERASAQGSSITQDASVQKEKEERASDKAEAEEKKTARVKEEKQKSDKEKTDRRSTVSEQKPPEQLKIQVGDSDYTEDLAKDNFGKALLKYFEEKQIILIFSEISKKNNEIFGTISLPSAIGDLEYYFYAKNKKSINEKDIKDAYAESVLLGYPLLFIAKGKLSKNAVTFVDSKLKSCKVVEI